MQFGFAKIVWTQHFGSIFAEAGRRYSKSMLQQHQPQKSVINTET